MTKDMTNGSPMKLILGFSIPLLFGYLFQQFYNLVDTLIVGRFLGVDALAAVGSTGGSRLYVFFELYGAGILYGCLQRFCNSTGT